MSFVRRTSLRLRESNEVVIVRKATAAYNMSARNKRLPPHEFDGGLDESEQFVDSPHLYHHVSERCRTKDGFRRRSSRAGLKSFDSSKTSSVYSKDDSATERFQDLDEDENVPIREISFKRESGPWEEHSTKSFFAKVFGHHRE